MRKPVNRVEVFGDSMRPTLEPGDRLLVIAWPWLRVGHLVAARTADRDVVKRVTSTHGSKVDLAGDHAGPYGTVDRAAILGRAVYRYAPTERAGRLH